VRTVFAFNTHLSARSSGTMQKVAMLMMLIAAFVCGVFAQEPKPMSNFGYLAMGYNIYYGNPRTTKAGVDPGFTTFAGAPIYQQNYNGGKSGDQRYAMPEGFSAVKDFGCALDFSSTSTYKFSNYTDTLKADASVSASGVSEYGAGSFSASGDYNSFRERIASSKQRMVSSTAECVVYYATVNTYAKPKLTDDFAAAIKQAPSNYGDGSWWFDLFDHFGTHYLTSAQLGARYGFTSYFDEMSWTNVEKTGWGVQAAASYEGDFKAGVGGGGGNAKTAQEAFDSNMAGYSEISLGATPVAGGDVNKWATQVFAEPMPIKYNLESLCEAMDTAAKKKGCQTGQKATEYCTKRLKEQRKALDSCQNAGDIQCSWDRDCHSGNICVNSKCLSGAMSISYRANPSLCLEYASPIRLNSCNGSPEQKWIFNSGEGQDYMQIQAAKDTTKCMDGGSMANEAALSVNGCSGAKSQTWAREVQTGLIYLPNGPTGNMCIDAGSGIKAGKNVAVWGCNVLPQQQYIIDVPKEVVAAVLLV